MGSAQTQAGEPVRTLALQGWNAAGTAQRTEPAIAHAQIGDPAPASLRPLPVPPSRFPLAPLTIVTGAVGPRPAPARTDPVPEGTTKGAGRLHRWVGRRGPRGRGVCGEYTRPLRKPKARPPLCPSKTHARRLTWAASNQRPGRRTSQKVGGTSRVFNLCFRSYLTGYRPFLKTQKTF